VSLRASLGILTLLPLVLAVCADNGDATVHDPASITGIEWKLDQPSMATLVDGPSSDATVSLTLMEGQAQGKAACNTYSGGYRVGSDGSLSFDAFAVTMMACDQPLMELESAYLDALSRVTNFSALYGMKLRGDGVVLTFWPGDSPPESLPLVGTPWKLTTIAQGGAVSSVVADTQVTLALHQADSTVAGSAGCNNYSGTYTEGEGGALSFSALATTRMMCAEDVMAQETAFLTAMEQVASYQIEGTQLRLLDDGGAMLLGVDGA
jgi:heat shock protein HslJ